MAGLTFGGSKVGQRVIGNKIDDRRYEIPEGWRAGGEVKQVIDPSTETLSTLMLLQPDHKLNLKPSNCSNHSYIRDFKRTEELVAVLQDQSAEDLEELMGLGRKMAKSHVERFKTFGKMPGKQALLMFGGDDLDASAFNSKEEKWAENHVRFICGLYGLLRPYDDVKPVRDVPMGAKLETDRGKTLVDFWCENVTKALSKDIAEVAKFSNGGKVLLVVNMSDEYWKAVLPSGLPKNARLVQITFEGANDDNTRKARSLFAGHIVRKKVDTVEGLTEFSHDDWVFDKTRSRDNNLLFNWDGEMSGASKKKKEDEKPKKKEADETGFVAGYHSDSDASAAGDGPAKKAPPAKDEASDASASAPRKKKKARDRSAASGDSRAERKRKKKAPTKDRERDRRRRPS